MPCLKIEEASVEAGKLRGRSLEPGTYTYERGSNVSAGEVLFRPGERISAKDLILPRDLGIERVSVYEPFSAGAAGYRFRDSRGEDRRFRLADAGRTRPFVGHSATIEGTVPDEYKRTRDRIAQLADEHDAGHHDRWNERRQEGITLSEPWRRWAR